MAVLNLETGEVMQEQPDITGQLATPAGEPLTPQQPPIAQQPQGRIINLETGGFIGQEPAQPAAPQAAEPQPSFPGAGFIEPLATIASGAVGEPLAGLAGLATAPFGGVEQATQNIEAVQEALTFQPRTEAGQQSLQSIAEFLQPAAEAITKVQKSLGNLGFEIGGPVGGTIAEVTPVALLELLGLKGVRSAASTAPRNVLKQSLSAAEEEAARAARKASEQTGIGLFKAQQTLNPTDIERQAFVAQLPEGSARARQALLNQNQQAFDGVTNFLESLAPPESISTAPKKFRTAAEKAIEAQKQIRAQKASPLFNTAFEQGAAVDLQPLRDFFDAELVDLPEGGEIERSLNKVNKLVQGKPKLVQGQEVIQAPTLKQLHNAKLEVDQMLNKVGEGSLGNTTKRKLTEAKDILRTQMAQASPLYGEALQKFAEASPPVDALTDSILGRVAGMDDITLKNVARDVFDPAETNPVVMQNAKRAIENVDPDAWTQITRAELERRMGNVRAELGDLTTTEAQENIPGQLFTAVFGNKKSRDVLFSALDPEQRKNLAFLQTALKRAAKGRPGGSQTGIRAEIRKELQGGMVQAVRDFIRSPISKTAGIGEEAAFNERTRALSEVLFDPTWKKEMAQIRELPVQSTKAQRLMRNILNSALVLSPGAAETAATAGLPAEGQ